MAATVIAGSDLGLLDSSLSILKRPDHADKHTNIGSGKNLFVNASNGNLIVQQKDVYLPSLGEDFNFVRTYNSQALLRGEKAWRNSAEISLHHEGGGIVVERGDQSAFKFKYDKQKSTWVSTDGGTAYETIEKVHNEHWPFGTAGDASVGRDLWFYILTRADSTKLYFDHSGKLKASVDANGVRMDYTFRVIFASSERRTLRDYAQRNLTI